MITQQKLTDIGFIQEPETNFFSYKDTLLDFELKEGIVFVYYGFYLESDPLFKIITLQDVENFCSSITSILDQEL